MNNVALRAVCVAALAAFVSTAAHAQNKPGLWESTTVMQMAGAPQIPPETLEKMKAMGMKVPGMGGTPIKLKSCVTQEMIDKYDGPPPQQTQKDCSIQNMQHSAAGMSADMVCTGGHLTGKGSIKTTHVDSTHTTMSMHFSGTSDKGRPVEWNMQGASAYLGAACGDVKPGQPVVE